MNNFDKVLRWSDTTLLKIKVVCICLGVYITGLFSLQAQAPYCDPTGMDCSWGDAIDGVIMGKINHTNVGCNTGGYGDFRNMETAVALGDTIQIEVQIGGTYDQGVSVWIDWDQSGNFVHSQHLAGQSQGTNHTSSNPAVFDIIIPSSAQLGTTAMRVGVEWDNYPIDPCNNNSFGEFQDYSVEILPANDLEMIEVFSTHSLNCGNEKDSISVMIANRGAHAQSNFDINVEVGGSYSEVINYTYSNTINSGDSDVVAIGYFDSRSGGNAEITAYTSLASDEDHSNDTVYTSWSVNPEPASPVTTDIEICGAPGSVELYADGSGNTVIWYDSPATETELHRGDTFQTPPLTESATYYVVAEDGATSCLSPSETVEVVSLELPESDFAQGQVYDGQLNSGDMSDPDRTCVSTTVEYSIPAPSGMVNDDYGSKWTVADYSVQNEQDESAGNYTFVQPATGEDAYISFQPDTNEYSQIFKISAELENLETGCTFIINRYIAIDDRPVAQFDAPATICLGEAFSVQINSTIGDNQDLLYVMDYNDGNIDTSNSADGFNHIYTEAGTYEVTLSVHSEFGCYDFANHSVTVHHAVEAAFQAPSEICTDVPFTVENNSHIDEGELSYSWTLSEDATSEVENPEYTYEESGTFTIVLKAESANGCIDSAKHTIQIYDAPEAHFEVEEVCANDAANFINSSENESSTFIWSFGNGDSSDARSPSITYGEGGTYHVILKETNEFGCVSEYAQEVEIYALPDSRYNAITDGSHTVSFIPLDENLVAYHWDFGDGETSEEVSPEHTFSENDIYETSMTGTNELGCQASYQREVDLSSVSFTEEANNSFNLNVYPNPSQHELNISFVLEMQQDIEIMLYDYRGRVISSIAEGTFSAGSHAIEFEHANIIPEGMYIIRMQLGDNTYHMPVKLSN